MLLGVVDEMESVSCNGKLNSMETNESDLQVLTLTESIYPRVLYCMLLPFIGDVCYYIFSMGPYVSVNICKDIYP